MCSHDGLPDSCTLDEADTMDQIIAAANAETTLCPDCGEEVTIGSWPFCVSKANPRGHHREVAYGWRFGS